MLIQHNILVNRIDGEKAWFIPIAQPQYRYLEALVEQRKEFEESIFYDITAWTLPLAFNLEWEKLRKVPALIIAQRAFMLAPVSFVSCSRRRARLNSIQLQIATIIFPKYGTSHVARSRTSSMESVFWARQLGFRAFSL